MDKYEIRGVFEKKGRAVFISHLDLFRTMQRAMKRSGIPVWYSQGYNPRIYLNFPLALSLGVESSTEIMDFEVTEQIPYQEMLDAVNKALPEGLHFVSMSEPVFKNKDIASAEYVFDFFVENITAKKASKAFKAMMDSDNIFVEKHSKSKGVVSLDIKPYINVVSEEIHNDFLRIDVILPAGMELNINSTVFTEAFLKYASSEVAQISAKRTKIMTKDGSLFT